MRNTVAIALVAGLFALTACEDEASVARTLASAESVRGETRIGDPEDEPELVGQVGRAAAGQHVTVSERGLARLAIDSGPQLLLGGGSDVEVVDEQTITLHSGRVFAESGAGAELRIEAGDGVMLRSSDAAISAEVSDGAVLAYVIRGEMSWRVGEERGVTHAGEQVRIADGVPSTEPVTLWQDWSGGLASSGPGDAEGAAGVGVLEARVPDEIGQARWPLVIRRLDVEVEITGDLAVTEVTQVFFNPASEAVEGLYRIRVPEEAALQTFAVDRNGRITHGYVREKAQARQAYEAQVYRGSTLDPALLEWVAPGRFQARIYPIQPGAERTIVIRYAEWLSPLTDGGSRQYRFPMGAGRDAPRIQEASITVELANSGAENVRAGMGAAIEEGRVRLRRSDFSPRSDFWLELDGAASGQHAWRARHLAPEPDPNAVRPVREADERDYWYLPLRLPDDLFSDAREEGMDLVIVADISAATDRAHLELGRSFAEALTAHMRPEDRVAIVASDLTIRGLGEDEPTLGEASPERVEALLDGLARVPAGGATDLGAALYDAADLLQGSDRPGAVVYVGDGAPTVGELEAEGLLDRLATLPEPLRLYAVAIGADANLELLETLTRGGGLALRVEERSAAADASLRLLAHATRPLAQRVTVDVGNGIENVYPRRAVDVVAGDVLSVVGRIRDDLPDRVHVEGTIAGQPFEIDIPVINHDTENSTDLRLRWAGERLRQLLLGGAGREEVAELGTRYGLITPFTSFYVPSAQELNRYGVNALPLIDRPRLLAEARPAQSSFLEGPASIVLFPLMLAGCASSAEEPQAVAAGSSEAWPSQATTPTSEPEDIAPPAEMEATEEWAPADDDGDFARPTTTAAPVQPIGGSAARGPPAASPPAPPRDEPSPDAPSVYGAHRALGNDALAGLEGLGGEADSVGGLATRSAGSRGARPSPRRSRARRLDAAAIDDLLEGEPDPEPVIVAAQGHGESGLRRTVTEDNRENQEARGRNESFRLQITTTTTRAHRTAHARHRCSDAARAPLSDRRSLWQERIGQQNHTSGWLSEFRRARRACELPSWRDRRAFLSLVLSAAGSIARMVDVYRLFDSGSARAFIRAAILRRVRSTQDLRLARNAFGLGHAPDWQLVEQVLERARGPEGRIRALRRLTMQYPDSFDLKLRLLGALEVAGHGPEARRLASRFRVDPRSDAGVRTAVGEMYLRMHMVEEARRVFSEIVEFAPLDELARRRLGDLYRAHGWFEDAYRQYQTLATIRPDDPSALLLLAQAAAGTGRIDEALRLEQRLMETAQPGAARGIASIAQLWTSVRLAKLRKAAREAGDEERLETLEQRMRLSGVLQGAGDLRVTLTWSHPDAQLALFTAHPGQELARPTDLAPEFGIEAFAVPEQEDGGYRFEVRRADPESPTALSAELVVVWHEGQADEVVHVVPLDFSESRASYAWTLSGNDLSDG